jgi:hypothetical protein
MKVFSRISRLETQAGRRNIPANTHRFFSFTVQITAKVSSVFTDPI